MSTKATNAIMCLIIFGLGATVLVAQPVPAPLPSPAPATPGTTAPTNTAPAPAIRFATPIYDFGKVDSGGSTKYTYFFTNVGSAELEVTSVHACGCIVFGDWTRKVPPGQTGSIPLQFNSAGYPAGNVARPITVTSNDPKQPQVILQLKGTIWKAIDFQPTMAMLNVPPDGQGATAVVRVLNNLPDPLNLSPPESNNRMVGASLITNQPGKEFQVALSAIPPMTMQNFQAEITLKTSSTNMPLLKIPVWVSVQPAMTILPKPVVLPPGPLTQKTAPLVRIQVNTTNQVQLSDPAINTEGVEIQIKELQPGRLYEAQLTFPQGFQVAQGKPLTFTAKSSLPQFPLVEVPIFQQVRPGLPPAVPPPPAQPAGH
jgi:hypothetical protein